MQITVVPVGLMIVFGRAHVNYTDPGLSLEHFKYTARRRGGLVCACVYVSKCLRERRGAV